MSYPGGLTERIVVPVAAIYDEDFAHRGAVALLGADRRGPLISHRIPLALAGERWPAPAGAAGACGSAVER